MFGDGFHVARLHPVLSRLVSIAAAAVGLLLTAVLFPIIALAIKLDSAGPVFFRQARLGLRSDGLRATLHHDVPRTRVACNGHRDLSAYDEPRTEPRPESRDELQVRLVPERLTGRVELDR